MYRNFYLFERQVAWLRPTITGARVVDSFTHRRDELVLRLEKEATYLLRIGVQSRMPYIILENDRNIKDPQTVIFKTITGQQIKGIGLADFDKIINLEFEDVIMQCVFFGKNPNVILYNSERTFLSSFKKVTPPQPVFNKDPGQKDDIPHPATIKSLKLPTDSQPVVDFICRQVAGFNKTLAVEACFRSQIQTEVETSALDATRLAQLIYHIHEIADQLNQAQTYLYEIPDEAIRISLVPLHYLGDKVTVTTYADCNRAWKDYLYRIQQHLLIEKNIQSGKQKIAKRIDYLSNTLKKISNLEDLDGKKKLSETKGNLLLTFATTIKKGSENVVLNNIYTPEGEEITIKLDPKLTVPENARRYFEKYKNIDAQKDLLVSKKETLIAEKEYWEKIYEEAGLVDNFKKADNFLQLLIQKNLVKDSSPVKKSRVLDQSAFRHVLVDNEWEILIGRNAENNDVLTFKYAHKSDIWLHAQGVPGSHVIIRLPDKNRQPPAEVIEQAASIAAYFSGSKNASQVPVNITEVRFVRKPRKAPAGTVVLSQAKTIFVTPKKYL